MNRIYQRIKKKVHPDLVKIVFDFIVIIMMAWAVIVSMSANKVAREANKLTRDALQKEYIPWLRAYDFTLSTSHDNKGQITFKIGNFSNYPALHLRVNAHFNEKENDTTYQRFGDMSLLPNMTQSVTVELDRILNANEIDAVKARMAQTPYIINMRYEDVDGGEHCIRQKGAAGAEGEITEYKLE
jgi:hypothetical protein